jgi:hypothetical protein
VNNDDERQPSTAGLERLANLCQRPDTFLRFAHWRRAENLWISHAQQNWGRVGGARSAPLIAIVVMIAVSMGVWVIAISMRVRMIAVGPIHMWPDNAIAADRMATSVGSASPSGTATKGDWRYTRKPVAQRREGHRIGWDHHETEQREC